MDLKPTLVITDKKEIACTLNAVVAGKNLVHVSGLYSRELLTSALLGVDYQNELLYLDCGQKEATNRNLLADRLIGCRTSQAGVRIEFPGSLKGILSLQGQPAFVSELPLTLTKFQRRDYFRLALNTTPGAICTLFGASGLTGRVLNISIGGLAAEFTAKPSVTSFSRGELYGRGAVDIPGLSRFNIDLITRFSAPNAINPSKLKVGFEFIGLPAHLEIALQKYITDQERKALSLWKP